MGNFEDKNADLGKKQGKKKCSICGSDTKDCAHCYQCKAYRGLMRKNAKETECWAGKITSYGYYTCPDFEAVD